MDIKKAIVDGRTALGIELGSTRIKGALINLKGEVLAVGIYDWENSLIDNIWTYSLAEIHTGLQKCYSVLREEVEDKYGVTLCLLRSRHGGIPIRRKRRTSLQSCSDLTSRCAGVLHICTSVFLTERHMWGSWIMSVH